MDRYIGMDVHAMSCTVCIVGPSGRQLKSDVVETNGQALVEYLRAIPRPRHLCFEEGTQSAWLHEILSPHVDELVVVGVTESRGAKSDAKDALGLAQALRLGAIDTMVFKAPSRFARLRALSTSYDQITRDVTRTQTRIKALFRGRGIQTPGQLVYSPSQRSQWLDKIPEAYRPSAELLWQELDAQRELKRDAEKQLIAESHRHPISTILESDRQALLALAATAAGAVKGTVMAALLGPIAALLGAAAYSGFVSSIEPSEHVYHASDSEERAVTLMHATGTGIIGALLAQPAAQRDLELGSLAREAVLAAITTRPAPRARSGTAGAANALRAALDELAGLSPGERALLGELLERIARAGP
jgi:Transposase